MKKSFWEIFDYNIDGILTTKLKIKVAGIQFDAGSTIGEGVAFSGISFSDYLGHYLEIKKERGVTKILGIY